MKNDPLTRLLQSAAQAETAAPNEMPFGFDTRVLALARSGRNGEDASLRRFLRQVACLSLVVIACGTAGAYHEWTQSDDSGETWNNQYAIADSAIGNALDQ